MSRRRRAESRTAPRPHLTVETLESRTVMSATALAPYATDDLTETAVAAASLPQPTEFELSPIAELLSTEEWVHSLTGTQLNQVLPVDIRYLTAAQLQSVPNESYFRTWSDAARAALQPWQVQSLNISAVGISALTGQQIGWLLPKQVQQVQWQQFHLLPPGQIQHLTTVQLQSLANESYFRLWSAEARAALQPAQVQALNIGVLGISALPSSKIGLLRPQQVQQVNWSEFHLLMPSQIQYLTAEQLRSLTNESYFRLWSVESRAGLQTWQVQTLNISALGVRLLTPQQLSLLTPSQVQQVQGDQFHLLPAEQVRHLTAEQLQSIPNESFFRMWSEEARAALKTEQVQSLNVAKLGIRALTNWQVSWLTSTQVKQVNWDQFHLLWAGQIRYLSSEQIKSLTSDSYFRLWSDLARASLRPWQLQTLDIAALGIRQLSLAQTAWLTAAQVQQVKWDEFQYLPPQKIPYLSAAQLQSLTNASFFRTWTPEARGALQAWQIQALNIVKLGVGDLASAQLEWLSAAQVKQVSQDELKLLPSSRIRFLATNQIQSLEAMHVYSWSEASRAALQPAQVQSLNIPAVGIMWLTAEQRSWLTTAQVRQVNWREFEYLNASQVPLLTTAQIQSLSSFAQFRNWTPAARAALTYTQIQALNIEIFGLEGLTSAQIGWLTESQVQSISYRDIPGLQAFQIPMLTAAQLQTIPIGAFLSDLPETLQKAFTREQLLSLQPQVWSEFSTDAPLPTNYAPAANTQVGPDGLPNGAHAVAEAEKVFALVPLSAATHTAIASGAWSDPRVWQGGKIPIAGARVVVSSGVTVTFDVIQTTAIKTLRIDGTLTFATDRNTQLKVDTVVVYSTGKLYVGTANRPVQDNVTARILIADNGAIDRVWDPYMLSRGIVSRGEVKMYGRTVTSYVAAAGDLMMGATKITLSSPPVGWRVGDKIVVTGTDEMLMNAGAEERTILAINGSVVTIEALRLNHEAPQEQGGFIHIANLSRNIELKAEDDSVIAERPHMMFMHNANVALSNVGVYGFGRTDKSQPINDPVVVNGVLVPGTGTNPRARYAVHFHHTGVDSSRAPAQVSGSVVVGSAGWGYVNHSSNVNFDGNIAYQVHGASFASEDGNEIGAMRGNLSISAIGTYGAISPRELNHDFGFNGHGFWLQGPGVAMENNISAGSRGAAYMLFMSSTKNLFDAANLDDPSLAGGYDAVPVSSVPIQRFFGNVAYAAKTGLDIWRHMPTMNDGYGYIDSFLSWNTSSVGIDVNYSGRLWIRNARLLGDTENYSADVGINTNFLTKGIIVEEGVIVGFQTGIKAPVRRDTIIARGYISAVVGIDVAKGEAAERTVTVNGTTFASLPASILKGQVQKNIYLHAPYDFSPQPARRADSLFAEDFITYLPAAGGRYRLYYDEQAPLFVPFGASNAMGYVPNQYLGLTNWQLMALFGFVHRGGMTPPNATLLAGVDGGTGVGY